jgi:hypothetical protein
VTLLYRRIINICPSSSLLPLLYLREQDRVVVSFYTFTWNIVRSNLGLMYRLSLLISVVDLSFSQGQFLEYFEIHDHNPLPDPYLLIIHINFSAFESVMLMTSISIISGRKLRIFIITSKLLLLAPQMGKSDSFLIIHYVPNTFREQRTVSK